MLKLFNTLTRKKEEFKPIKKGQVGMYTCGPTVYDLSHVGHARTYISFDILNRYLKTRKFKVRYVVNITDVEDKILNRAKQEKIDPKKLTEDMTKKFLEDFSNLGILKPDAIPKVTENISIIIKFIQKLINKDYAYPSDGDVYFSVRKFKNYGRLSRNRIEDLEVGVRVEPGENKKDPLDFALWKKAKKDETIRFQSPWGEGRPGWHIECSAMAGEYIGDTLDIHGGGKDLIFPHHEDEIAQSEAVNNKQFARFWIHTGMVTVGGEKMSKSLGNFITIREVLKEYPKEVLRLYVLRVHYRSPLDFNKKSLVATQKALNGLYDFISRILEIQSSKELNKKIVQLVEKTKKEFGEFMDDDLNTPKVLASIFEIIKEVNKIGIDNLGKKDADLVYKTLLDFDRVLGLELSKGSEISDKISGEILKLVKEREEARKKGDFKKADKIRNELLKQGIELEDTPSGTRIIRLPAKNQKSIRQLPDKYQK